MTRRALAFLPPPSAYFQSRSHRIRNKRSGWRCNSSSWLSRRTASGQKMRQLLVSSLHQTATVGLAEGDDRKPLSPHHPTYAPLDLNTHVSFVPDDRPRPSSRSHAHAKCWSTTKWITSSSETNQLTRRCPDNDVSWYLFPMAQEPPELNVRRRA